MESLRVRLVVGVVLLAAAGLALVGAVTYAEQRAFLLGRVDQQARGAFSSVSQALDAEGFALGPIGSDGNGAFDRGPVGDRGTLSSDLPPGTYGQRRTSAGSVVGHIIISYGGSVPVPPRLPARLLPGHVTTVASMSGSGTQYRVLAERDAVGSTVVAIPLGGVQQTLRRLLAVEAIVIGGVLVALGLLAWFVVRLGLRPLDRIARTAGAIAAGDLAHRVSPATPRTEVGRLGLALNMMLERLQQAFDERQASEERLRRFLADASHELRTPLASIRGYAEVFRMGAAADPEDTHKAMRRIEEEAARMGVLVEDLLTLARLDAVRGPVRAPADLATLAGDAVDAARVRAPEREIGLLTEAGAVVLGDAHGLRQVTDNLLRNAIAHTRDGTPIDVTVTRTDARIALEVRDHGRGLPPGDTSWLFERFWRARPGRERGRGGAGLGLAIVEAIVEGHGGQVAAENAAGGGARFTVLLPAADPVGVPHPEVVRAGDAG